MIQNIIVQKLNLHYQLYIKNKKKMKNSIITKIGLSSVICAGSAMLFLIAKTIFKF